MKILVTGGTGFIGKHFTVSAVGKGHEVACLVRDTSDTSFLEKLGVELVRGSIENASEAERALSATRPEVVVNCAALVMSKDESLLMSINAGGTRNICRSCLKNKTGRLLHLSSIATVCGNEMPLTDDMPFNARNAYGRSKIEAERVVEDFRGRGLRVAVLRPCMVYGETEPHAMGTILGFASRGLLPLIAMPEQDSGLHLVYVGNLVKAMELALESPDALNGTFIVADKDIITLRLFVEIIYAELKGRKPPVIPGWIVKTGLLLPAVRKIFDRIYRDRVYDISRAEKILGYDPPVSAAEGLRRTVRCWEKTRAAGGKLNDLDLVADI